MNLFCPPGNKGEELGKKINFMVLDRSLKFKTFASIGGGGESGRPPSSLLSTQSRRSGAPQI